MTAGGVSTISVVVPTYARPQYLEQCISALCCQRRMPDEVVVVVRKSDVASRSLLDDLDFSPLRIVYVEKPGVIAALRVGVSLTTGSVIAFTDDDAEPSPEWVAQLEAALQDPRVGGVGGRDLLPASYQDRRTSRVGHHAPFGKVFGNHHRGKRLREVDVLKGVNMAFRSEALALPLDEVLRGEGAQVHYEMAISAWAKHRKWVLLYDPEITVRHHLAPRPEQDRRVKPPAEAIRNEAFNWLRTTAYAGNPTMQVLYGLLIGGRGSPGILRAVTAIMTGDNLTAKRLRPSIQGQLSALEQIFSLGSSLDQYMTSCEELRYG